MPIVRTTAARIQSAGGLEQFLSRRKQHHPAPPLGECNAATDPSGYAHVVENSAVNASNANITLVAAQWSLYSPLTSPLDGDIGHSVAQIWLSSHCGMSLLGTCSGKTSDPSCMNTVEVGSVSYTQDNHLYMLVYSTNDGYSDVANNGQFMNTTLGPSFVQTSTYLANEQDITQYTTYPSMASAAPNVMVANVELEQGVGWWVYVGIQSSSYSSGNWLGYFPSSLYTTGFATSANSFQMGGEVYEVTNETNGASGPLWLTRMGSGATAGFANYVFPSAFFQDGEVLANGTWNSTFYLGQGSDSTVGSTVPSDYGLLSPPGSGVNFYFGTIRHTFNNSDYGLGFWSAQNLPADSSRWHGYCGPGAFVTGLSKVSGGNSQAHALRCGPGGSSEISSVTWRYFGHTTGDNRATGAVTADKAMFSNGDWDPGYNKAECDVNEILQGFEQTKAGYLDTAFCALTAGSPHTQQVEHSSCNVQNVSGGDSAAQQALEDWDYGEAKAACQSGYYVAGVSIEISTSQGTPGAPHSILCCKP